MFLNESRCRTAEKCMCRFYWSYLHGGYGLGTNRISKPLIVGNLLHAGLAAHYLEEAPGPAIQAELKKVIPTFESLDYQEKNNWLDEAKWAGKVIDRYVATEAPKDNFTVVGVEQAGAVLLGDACWQCGVGHAQGLEDNNRDCGRCGAEQHHFVFRLDLLVRDDLGYAVVDHKSTAAGVDEWYLKGFDNGGNSSQLWGYCYGAQKQSGHKIGRYYINILRKVKAAAEEPDLTKACPGCGRKKIKGCLECQDQPTPGRVPRMERPADRPFVRESFPFNEKRAEWFVRSRVRLANKITEHRRRLAEGDPDAFPHNPTAVGCDPDLCLGTYPGQPLMERYVDETRYFQKGPDYVMEKQLAFEEGQ